MLPTLTASRRSRLWDAAAGSSPPFPPDHASCDAQPEDPTRTGCLSPDLCNQLVVNEHPWCPPTHEREALTSLTSPQAPSLSPTPESAEVGLRPTVQRQIARRHLQPRVTPRFGVACASRGAFCPCASQKALGHARPHLACLAWQGPPPFLGWRRQPVRRCSLPLHRPDDEATDASCRAPPSGARLLGELGEENQGPFPRQHTNATAFQARSAFHR